MAVSPNVQKWGYLTWNIEMDSILTSTLYDQINKGNKGEGDFKNQAYQAAVDKLRVEMGIYATVDHVKHQIKVWKKHYAVITEIRTYTKFKWDKKKKMLVIPIEDLREWKTYCKLSHVHSLLFRANYQSQGQSLRATGEGAEQFEESAAAMEFQNEAVSTAETGFGESNKRQKRDRLADVVTSFECMSKAKEPPRPTIRTKTRKRTRSQVV
ncbi:hypothetical protein AgCh_009710 [Apium graveolens]